MTETRTFEQLECYRSAREFRKAISSLCRTLPASEAHRLRDQLLRATRSVTANIAEGYGRHHHQENAQFCRQARGSLSECPDHLNTALDEEFVEKGVYDDPRSGLLRTWRILNGYIAYLQRCAQSGVPERSPCPEDHDAGETRE